MIRYLKHLSIYKDSPRRTLYYSTCCHYEAGESDAAMLHRIGFRNSTIISTSDTTSQPFSWAEEQWNERNKYA